MGKLLQFKPREVKREVWDLERQLRKFEKEDGKLTDEDFQDSDWDEFVFDEEDFTD